MTVQNILGNLLKYGPKAASFCLFLSFSQYNLKQLIENRWRAWDSTMGPYDRRRKQIHCAMAAAPRNHFESKNLWNCDDWNECSALIFNWLNVLWNRVIKNIQPFMSKVVTNRLWFRYNWVETNSREITQFFSSTCL